MKLLKLWNLLDYSVWQKITKNKGETIVKIWCEWDMEFSGAINDYDSVYGTMKEALADLETINWKMVEYNNWQEVEEDGLLSIEEI